MRAFAIVTYVLIATLAWTCISNLLGIPFILQLPVSFMIGFTATDVVKKFV